MRARIAFSLAAGWVLCAGGAARGGDAVPREGMDVAILQDGSVLRCRVGAEGGGTLELGFPSGTIRIPRGEVAEVRRFADFDPAPRDDGERKKAAEGLLRWAGGWVTAARRDALLQEDAARARKRREEAGSRFEWENRWKRNTAHFAIEANLSRRDVDLYEEALESFYSYFTSALKVSVKRRIPVYLLRTREEFLEFATKDVKKISPGTVGYFVPKAGAEHLVLFDWQGNREETLRVMFHECTHLLVHLANAEVGLPTMFNEGLAEYYGAARMRNGKFVRGGIQDGRLLNLGDMIAEKKLPPLDDLLAHGHPDRNAPGWKKFTVEDYAHSWAFVHFLFHGNGGKYVPRLLSYLNAHWGLKQRDAAPGSSREWRYMAFRDDRDLLLRTLKFKDYESMEKEFLAYVETLAFEGAEAHVSRGLRALLREKDPAGAEREFREALAKGGDDPQVLAALVRAYAFLPGREQEAASLLDRVFEKDPLNLALRYGLTAWFLDGETEVPHLRLCAEISPADPVGISARAWLAFRGRDRERHLLLSLAESSEADGLRAAIRAKENPTAAEWRRLADLALRLGDPAEALEPARRSAEAAPGDPESFAAWAKAAAALGNGTEFAKAMAALREAARKAEAEGGPSAKGVAARETALGLVEATAYALALDRRKEARDAVDAWYGGAGGRPRIEGEWVLHAGLPLLAGDPKAAGKRIEEAVKALPGAERLAFLFLQAKLAGAVRGDLPAPGDGTGEGEEEEE